jgi:pimeloyl-ACP methyl ester carboxylesterase
MLNRREFSGLVVVGAAASVAVPALASAPADEGAIGFHNLASSNVPGDVGVAIYEPPGYDAARAESYSLLLWLHGGNGSEKDMLFFKSVFDREIASGRVPPLVIATPSGRRSLYMEFRDGTERWESYILSDVLPFVRRSAHVEASRERTFIGGVSMGGLGSLRIAFKHPELFAGVIALEPAIEAALEWKGAGARTRFCGRSAPYIRCLATPSIRAIGQRIIPRRSQAWRLTDCLIFASISRSATKTRSIFTKAWNICTGSCSMPGSLMNICWCTAPIMSVPRFCRAWRMRSVSWGGSCRRPAGLIGASSTFAAQWTRANAPPGSSRSRRILAD